MVLGLKLINDVIGELNSAKFVIFKVCLDAIEFYAPPAPPHRPRPVPKSREIVNQLALSILELMGSKDSERGGGSASAKVDKVSDEVDPAKKSEKDGRGRAGLAKPNLKDLLIEKTRVAAVEETIDVKTILRKHSSSLPIISSRPSSRSGRVDSRVDVDGESTASPVDGYLPLMSTVSFGDEVENLEEQIEGFRKVRSISKGNVVSKRDWKGASGKIGK